MRDWVSGSNGRIVSMAICSEGQYGIEAGLIYSYPVKTENGAWKVVEGLELSDFAKEKLKATEAELQQERDLALTQ